jgi:hypothetical protein
VLDTLQLIYDMPRPYTLFIYSLKVIPNTELEKAIKERGVELDKIDSSFFVIPPRVGNLLLYVLCLFKPPEWMWKLLLRRVRASTEPNASILISVSCCAPCTSASACSRTPSGWTSRSRPAGPDTRSGDSAWSASGGAA